MTWIDFAALFVYLAVVAAVGIYASRLVHDLSDFVMPRRFGKLAMLMFGFGTGTHSDQAVSVASKTFTNGLSGIWYQWLNLFVTPFYWVLAPLLRRTRAVTTADIFQARYGRSVATLYAAWGALVLVVDTGVVLKGSGAIIDAISGGAVSSDLAILGMTALVLVYGVAGGLSAAILTDLLQGFLTLIFSFMLLPFILNAVGGMAGLHASIRDPEMFSLVAPSEIGTFYIAVIAVNALIGIVAQPQILANCSAGRTELDGRIGLWGGNFIKRFCTVAWCLTGLAAVAHYSSATAVDPDQVYGLVARDFLPRVAPGLIGLFLASLLASVMSTCDANMICSSGLFAENLYRPRRPGRSPRHYLGVVRLASVAVMLGAVGIAFSLGGVVEGLELFWKLNPMMGIAFWLGLVWRRATPAGAWAAFGTSLAVLFVSSQPGFAAWLAGAPGAEALRLVVQRGAGPELYLPWQMIFYLAAGLAAGVFVSLCSRPVETSQLESFYALLRTPVREGEPVGAACTLPDGVAAAPRRDLLPGSSLEIQVPSRTTVLGFLASWLLVGLVIWIFYAVAAA